ncbi:MAG TPA: pyridoxamine 5'-phosphate oxidase family protein [Propionibacteriaceae bacterium]
MSLQIEPALHSPGAPPTSRRLSTSECYHLLTNHREGRLSYATGRGPRAVVVSYAMTNEHIVVRLPDYNDIVHYAPGADITLEVADETATVSGLEMVCVGGRAALARHDDVQFAQLDFAETWPEGVHTSVVCLPMTAVEGYELADH